MPCLAKKLIRFPVIWVRMMKHRAENRIEIITFLSGRHKSCILRDRVDIFARCCARRVINAFSRPAGQ